MLHGSGSPDIQEFEPRQSNDLAEFGNRRAVYAASDGIWPIYFAVVNRDGPVTSLVNSCARVVGADGIRSRAVLLLLDQRGRAFAGAVAPRDDLHPAPRHFRTASADALSWDASRGRAVGEPDLRPPPGQAPGRARGLSIPNTDPTRTTHGPCGNARPGPGTGSRGWTTDVAARELGRSQGLPVARHDLLGHRPHARHRRPDLLGPPRDRGGDSTPRSASSVA